MSVMWRLVSAPKPIRPRCGIKCRSTCSAYERKVLGRMLVRVDNQYRSHRPTVHASATAADPDARTLQLASPFSSAVLD